ncbi:MAG TPA: replication-relaxation family protein [Pilimelia sp.]|nr:replication-relaxation family protein [Pilimelia sp.]
MVTEVARLTPRDRLILDLLADHHTFTTDQLAHLAFGSLGRARNRLSDLHRRGVLDRFRHFHRPGSQSWRWTLGPVGAAIVAAGRNEAPPRPATVRDTTARLATSPTLAHLIGTNGFFVALMAHARDHDGAALIRWWNEARCRAATGNLVRPDGHGVWAAGGWRVPFWLEHDTGTESLRRVVAKLDGYATLAGTRRAFPVLFWLPTSVREANLRALMTRTGLPAGVTVATAAADLTADHGGPAGPVWHTPRHTARLPLADLPAPDGAPWDG